MTREWTGNFDVTQNWAGTFDITQSWAGTFDVTQAWAGTVDVYVESFTGAYDDIDNIAGIYSMARRTLTSYTGNLVRLRRDSDNNEQDFGADADGDLDTDAVADFLGANNGYVVTLYDQSGNGNDATQATAAKQPLYVASGQNGRTIMRFDGTDDGLLAPRPGAQPVSFVQVGKRAATVGYFWDGDGSSNRFILGSDGSPAGAGIYAGTWLRQDWSDAAAYHVYSGVYNGASSLVQVDNQTALTGNAGTQQASTNINIGIGHTGGSPLDGEIGEIVFADVAWSTANRDAAKIAANDYWQVF